MNNSGSSDEQLIVDERTDGERAPIARRSPSVMLVLLLIAGVAMAIYFGTNVLGVLFGMLAPPLPPLPAGLTEVSHESESYGVDLWTYTSADEPCGIALQFQETTLCSYAPMQCGALQEVPNYGFETNIIARCTGSQEFSIFTMEWNARVYRVSADGSSKVELEREVFWIGNGTQSQSP
jgi:hypothetical protein